VRLAASVLLLVALGVKSAADPAAALKLPKDLENYRAWQAASKEPFPVPYDLWIQCVHPSREQEAKAARMHGPHNQLQIQVFTNPAVAGAFYSSSLGPFPEGSIVVKEKSILGGKAPVAIAAMIKGARGSSPASGDWKFVYVSSEGPTVATAACQDCHRTAPADFLFRSYRSGLPR